MKQRPPTVKQLMKIKGFRREVKRGINWNYAHWHPVDGTSRRFWKRYMINDVRYMRQCDIDRFLELVPEAEPLRHRLPWCDKCAFFYCETPPHTAEERDSHVADYMRERMSEGHMKDFRRPNVIVCFSASTHYPLTVGELSVLPLIAQGCREVTVHVHTDDTLGLALGMCALYYEFYDD